MWTNRKIKFKSKLIAQLTTYLNVKKVLFNLP